MGLGYLLLGLVLLGTIYLGITYFPVMNTNVTEFVSGPMVTAGFSDLLQFLVKILPYAGLALIVLAAFWYVAAKEG